MSLAIDAYQKYLPNLKKISDTEWRTNCPFHNDSTPSFFINEVTTQYYCHGCGLSGNIYTFLKKIKAENEIIEIEKTEKLISYDIKLKEDISSSVIQQLHRNLMTDSVKLKYLLRERLLSYYIIKKFTLGYDPESDRYAIPIKSRTGKIVNIKLHNSYKDPKSISWRKGSGESRLFPYNALLRSKIVITEGEFDCLLLHTLGINAITNTTGADTWERNWSDLFRGRDVIIIFDSDSAGDIGSKQVYDNIRAVCKQCSIIRYSETFRNGQNKIDVTDFVKGGGDIFKLLKIQRKF